MPPRPSAPPPSLPPTPFLPAWTQGGLVPVLALIGFVLIATAVRQNWKRRQHVLEGRRIAKAEAAAEEAQRLADEESAAAAAAVYEANRIHRARLAKQRAEWEAAAARSLSGRAASVMARAWLVPALLSLKAPPPPEPVLQTKRRSLSGIFGAALRRTFSRASSRGSEYVEAGGRRRRRRSVKALVRSGSQIMRSWSRCSGASRGSEPNEGARPRRGPLTALVRTWSHASQSSAEVPAGARHRPLKALMRNFSRCSESSVEEAGGAQPTPLKALMRSCSRSWSRDSGGGGGDCGRGGGYSRSRTFSGALERARRPSVSFHSSVSPTPAASGERGQKGRKHRKRRSKASPSAAASKWAGPPVSAPAAEGTWSSAGWTLEAPKRSPAQLLTAEKEARGHSDGAGGSQSSDSSPASIRADSPFDAARRELHEMLEGVEASVEGFVTEAKTEDWLIETCSTLGRSPSAGAVGAGVGLRLACATGATDSGAMASPQHRKRRRRTRGGSGHSSPTKSGHSSPTKSGHSSPNNGSGHASPTPTRQEVVRV